MVREMMCKVACIIAAATSISLPSGIPSHFASSSSAIAAMVGA